MSYFRVKKLYLSRGGKRILHELSCEFQSGEFVILVGPNGAGKTSFLKCLAGLLNYSGNIELRGQNLKRINLRERAKVISYLGQDRRTYWPVTVQSVVSLGRLPFINESRRKNFLAAKEAMEDCNLLQLQHRSVGSLSGGEIALTMLARVLAGKPEIILADEPISGLDPSHQLHVMKTLEKKAELGALVILVIHDLSLAARFAKRVLLIHDGSLVQDGPVISVLSPNNLKKFYGINTIQGTAENIPFILPSERTNQILEK